MLIVIYLLYVKLSETIHINRLLGGRHLFLLNKAEKSHDHLDEFRRSMQSLEDVQQCYYVAGHTDFIIIVTSTDMAAYEEFSRQVFTDNPNIRRFHSNVVVNRVKSGLQVPISEVD
ncbi:Lrp/AsnC ligand binding domain-containing protein [Kiloniella sp.]|uniref:Lrp/AsnC ligand binding domain-containing protein n=1 Tax=Kiloniella sp. TaxID=1938587 RepID=UPI003B016DFA